MITVDLIALAQGYVLFSVNGDRCFTYTEALKLRARIPIGVAVCHTGWHIIDGWRGFYVFWP